MKIARLDNRATTIETVKVLTIEKNTCKKSTERYKNVPARTTYRNKWMTSVKTSVTIIQLYVKINKFARLTIHSRENPERHR